MDIDSEQLGRALGPINEAWSMPAGFYTDPAIFAAERERVLLATWIFLARDDQVPKPGDYRAIDTTGGPVILARGGDGVVRTFVNACRHRGGLLIEGNESGNAQRIVCPYHAWSYRPDGSLAGCPDMNEAVDFDRTQLGLIELRTESWAGFVFTTFNTAAPPLIDTLGDLPDRFASHRLDEMRCTWTTVLEPRCNWKLVLENAMETYHTGTVHRRSVGTQQSHTVPTVGDWLCIQVTSGRSIATLPGTEPSFPTISGLDDDARLGTYFTVLHAACQFAVAQDCMWWLNITPLAVDHTRVEIGGCFPESVTQSDGFEVDAKPYYDRWEMVGREDLATLERQQRALGNVAYRPGRLSWRDDQVQRFDRWIAERLGLSAD